VDLDNMTPEMQAALDKTKEMLKGKSIGLQTGASMVSFIENQFNKSELREYEKLETRDLDMQAERIDVGMEGSSYWEKVEDKKEVDIVAFGPKFANGSVGGGIAAPIRKGQPELAAKVNAALDAMVADGTVAKIAKKWFGTSDAAPIK
jgi:octopine/nopaline transport system substrate-binding protein